MEKWINCVNRDARFLVIADWRGAAQDCSEWRQRLRDAWSHNEMPFWLSKQLRNESPYTCDSCQM